MRVPLYHSEGLTTIEVDEEISYVAGRILALLGGE